MQCDKCGKHCRVTFSTLRVDTIYKEYICKNGHITIFRKFGDCEEVNGKVTSGHERLNLEDATKYMAIKQNNIKKLKEDYGLDL